MTNDAAVDVYDTIASQFNVDVLAGCKALANA